mmetsp:Transcript_25113/g.39137  ORF Transcript_25113/g.39137 Transcript_25113/m.39137 type:complete len:221 (-) Transcript_25113:58-720(-)
MCTGLSNNGISFSSNSHSKSPSCVKKIKSRNSRSVRRGLNNRGSSNTTILDSDSIKRRKFSQMLFDVLDDDGLGDDIDNPSISSNNRNTVSSSTTKRDSNIIKRSSLGYRLEAVATSQVGNGDLHIGNLWDVDNDILQTDVFGVLGLFSMDHIGNKISKIKESHIFLGLSVINRSRENMRITQSGEGSKQIRFGGELDNFRGSRKRAHLHLFQHLFNLSF